MFNKKLFLVVLTIILLIPIIKAQPEYIYGNQWANWQPAGVPPSEPYNPKIACNERADICAVLWYEDSSLYRAVKLGISYDRLETTPSEQYTVYSVNFNPTVRGYYDYYNLPYDITYDSDSGKFRIFVSPNYVTYKYTFDSANGLVSLGSVGYSCLSFGNESSINCFKTSQGVSPNCDGYSNCVLVKSGILDWDTSVFTQTNQKAELKGSQAYACNRLKKLKGFMESNNKGQTIFDVKYDLEYGVSGSCTSTGTITGTFKDMPSSLSSYDGLFYWDRSNYIYYRFTNTSNPSQNGVYRIATNDLNTYGSSELYYSFNTSINEAINSSDFYRAGYEVFVYERETNSSQYPTGLWAYNSPVITISYISQYEIPTGEIYPIKNPADIKFQIECDNYTTSDTGDTGFVYSKCYDPTIKMFSSNYVPTYYTRTLNMTDDLCQSAIVNILYTKQPNVTIRVMDSFSLTPIQNATVILGSSTSNTNSDGYAYFTNVDALSNPELEYSNPSTCYYELNYNGDPKPIPITITANNYSTYNDIIYIAKNNEQTGSLYFETQKTVQVNPYSANLVIHIRTQDGQEIKPESAVVNITGTNDIYYIIPPKTKVNIHSGDFPQQWQIFGNGTIQLHIKLIYGDTYDYDINVSIPETRHIYLDINKTFDEQYCISSEDCQRSDCIGNVFKTLNGCVNNTCEYSETECNICDAVAGCIDYPTDVECSSNLDCLNLSSCLSVSRSRIGVCGENNKCVIKTINCPTGEQCQNLTIGGSYGYAFTCESSFLCAINDGTYLPFRIYKITGFDQNGEPINTLIHSSEYKCNIENYGTKTCISGTTITPPQLSGIPIGDIGIYTTPENWQYEIDQDGNYKFYDIAIECLSSCNVTYKYCPNGCIDGECLSQPSNAETQARNMIQSIINWWYVMFPDIYAQTFAWLFITFLISGLLSGSIAYIQRGSGGLSGQEVGTIFISSSLAMFLVGSFIGTMPFFVGVVFSVLAGFIVWKLWSG